MVVLTMVIATQYAVTELGYEYTIVHPSNADIRFIGSDNSSDGVRVLRVDGTNGTNATLKLYFGNWSSNTKVIYSSAFGIVNEEKYPLKIMYINVTPTIFSSNSTNSTNSTNATYLKIWLHGNRTANAESNVTDPSTVFMYDNGTMVNASNTTAWILGAGDKNYSNMCYNVSDRTNSGISTPWDNTSRIRYSESDINAVSNVSDFVWVQVAIDIPAIVDSGGPYSGIITIYFESETH